MKIYLFNFFEEPRPDKNESVSQYAIDMLSQLFPNRKKSVLELILKRCDLNLLKAIEQCSSINSSAFKPTTPTSQVLHCFRVLLIGF